MVSVQKAVRRLALALIGGSFLLAANAVGLWVVVMTVFVPLSVKSLLVASWPCVLLAAAAVLAFRSWRAGRVWWSAAATSVPIVLGAVMVYALTQL